MSAGVTTAIALVEVLITRSPIVIGLVVIGPLVASARSGPRGVLAVTVWAIALSMLLGVRDHVFSHEDHILRIAVVASGGLIAIWTASIRQSRERTAELLTAQAAVARILSSSESLAAASPRILEAIGETLDWEMGAVWRVRRRLEAIVCEEIWASDRIDAMAIATASRGLALERGRGLPGRVWETGQPVWVQDLATDTALTRSELAILAGLRSGFCFPVRSSRGVVGAVEFFASTHRQPDRHLLDLMDALGGQIGEYIERKRAEQALVDSEARKTAILEAALDCVITMDHEGRVVEFNPAAESTFGYTADEAIGEELARLIIPLSLRERHREGLQRYLETGERHVLDRRLELIGMRKDRTEFPVELTLAAIAGDPPIFAGYIRDLSERRRGEEVQRQLALIVESSEDAIMSADRRGLITSWNRGAEQLYGYSAEEALGKSLTMLVPQERRGEESDLLERVLADERIEGHETQRLRRDGTLVDVELSVSSIKDTAGMIVGASAIVRDNTERKRAAEQRVRLLQMEQEARVRMQQAESRASFLAQAQAFLSSSLDYATTLENLARLSVPYMADWCLVDMMGPDGKLARLALAHTDPERERYAHELQNRYATESDPERGALRAVLTSESQLIREVPDDALARAARDDKHLELLREIGLRSAIIVPLRGRDKAIGAITFLSAESGRLYDEEDLALAEDLASRAAIAMDNARLYGERSYIASTLQQSLMPDNLPEIPGLELAARYLAAGEGTEVGGDFYDIYRAGENTWGLAIGDVRGKGPRAAAVTALTRYTMRTASLSESTPSRILATLNEAMLRQRSDDRFCTVAYASIEPNPNGGMTMLLGVGGHPLPLLLRRDGTVEQVGSPGTLIGLVPDPDIVDDRIDLHPGESLILYTDGVSEARSEEEGLFGEERLIELVRSCANQGAAEIAERIEQRVFEFQDHESRDDLAVLVIRVNEPRSGKRAGRERNRRAAPA